MSDPLKSLLVDAKEVDRTRLAECLDGLMGIDGETGRPTPMARFDTLATAKLKVLVYLLARKASVLLGKGDEEAVSRSEISERLGMPDGTVGRTVRELADERLVTQDESKRYMVPSHQLNRIHAMLNGEGG